MSIDGQWLAIGEAAKYLGVSRDTLRRWEKKGKLKTVRSPSNRRYYTKEDLEAAMSGKATEAVAVASTVKLPEKQKSNTSISQSFLWGFLGLLVTLILGVIVIFILK